MMIEVMQEIITCDICKTKTSLKEEYFFKCEKCNKDVCINCSSAVAMEILSPNLSNINTYSDFEIMGKETILCKECFESYEEQFKCFHKLFMSDKEKNK